MRKVLWITCLVTVALVGAGALLVARTSRRRLVTAPRHGPQIGIDDVDHRDWDQLLGRYVDPAGRVNYAGWHASDADRRQLDRYLSALGRADPNRPSSREARLAFWINAYNAVTIAGILDVYPTSSIRDHTSFAVGYNIWRDLLLSVGGRRYSLNDMEHNILRRLNEPRIHFAIVCASVGCPRLLAEAYRADRIESQLKANTTDFFSQHDKFQVASAGDRILVSPILDWFGEDFGETPRQRLQRLAEYLPATARKLVATGDFRVGYLDYDWSLNSQ